jgi:hypothetical protein
MRTAILVSAFLLATPTSAETIPGDRIIVLDGDTIALPCGRPTRGCAEKVRLLDIDALGL